MTEERKLNKNVGDLEEVVLKKKKSDNNHGKI